MNLFQRNSSQNGRWAPSRGRKGIVVATLIVGVLFLIDALSGGAVRTIARAGSAFIWSRTASIGDAIYGSGIFSTRRGLIRENAALIEQVAHFQERSAAYRALQEENIELRKLMKLRDTAGGANAETGITAPIISSFRASPYGTFQIGAGSSDSVSPGSIVLSSEGFVIGRVETVSANSSLVEQIFAPNVTSDAVLRGVGVAVLGLGGGNARTDFPRQSPVEVGDTVVSPIFGARAIGVVGEVREESGDAYKRVYIYLPVNLSVLKFVYIVRQ